MLGIILGAFALCVTMFFVGRHEAENDLKINLGISAVVGIVTALLSIPLGIFALPIGFALCMWAITKFCYLGWGKAALVSASFFIVQIAFALLMR